MRVGGGREGVEGLGGRGLDGFGTSGKGYKATRADIMASNLHAAITQSMHLVRPYQLQSLRQQQQQQQQQQLHCSVPH